MVAEQARVLRYSRVLEAGITALRLGIARPTRNASRISGDRVLYFHFNARRRVAGGQIHAPPGPRRPEGRFPNGLAHLHQWHVFLGV